MGRSRELAELATVFDAGGSLGFRNRVINGGMQINQRGGSLATNNTQGYFVDRMWGFSSVTAATFSQVSNTGLSGFPFAARGQRNAGNTGTGGVYLGQIVESVNMLDLQGQSVTVSFWARAGSNYSATANALTVTLVTGTTADQGLNQLIAGWAGVANQSSSVTLTTSWQYFSRTFSVASNAQELSVHFSGFNTGTAGANDFFDITGVQLEAGSVATPFERRDYGRELIMCQRYYQRMSGTGISFTGYWDGTNAGVFFVYLPTTMRAISGIGISSGSHFAINNSGVGNPAVSAVGFSNATLNSLRYDASVASGGASGGKAAAFNATSSSAWFEINGGEL